MTRSDANQKEIVKKWRKISGARCLDLHNVRKGCPDLLVSFSGVNILVEIKTENGSLSKEQEKFHKDWTGWIIVARTFEELVTGFYRILSHYDLYHLYNNFDRNCILATGISPEKLYREKYLKVMAVECAK